MVANHTSFTSGRDLNSVSENVELLTGQRGNQLDRAVTYRDLESLGVATLSKVGSSYKATANSVLTSSSGVVYFPSKPNNVVASGAFNTILIDWYNKISASFWITGGERHRLAAPFEELPRGFWSPCAIFKYVVH